MTLSLAFLLLLPHENLSSMLLNILIFQEKPQDPCVCVHYIYEMFLPLNVDL